MKKHLFIQTAKLAFAIALCSVSVSIGQAQTLLSSQPVTESQKVEIRTEIGMRVSNSHSPLVSPNEMTNISNAARSSQIISQTSILVEMALKAVTSSVVTSMSDIVSGNGKQFVTDLSSNHNSIAQSTNVKVSVNYEARPIGGILSVTVDLVPLFSGVGVANRPLASKSITQAVDEVTPKSITLIVAALSADLQKDLMSNPSAPVAAN